jgi:O-antigen ligase
MKSNAKLALTLLVFSPLVYSADGDPYRAYKVLLIGALFLLISPPKINLLTFRFRYTAASVLAIALLIAIQPIFVVRAELLYNLKYIIALLACFLPSLCFMNRSPIDVTSQLVFIDKALHVLFGVAILSLVLSSVTGLGEIYSEGRQFQQRSFAWLGDSFSPVMVFFLFYFFFRRSFIGVLISAVCLIGIMQAKMAIGMAAFGCLIYILIFGKQTARLILIAVVGLVFLFLPKIFDLAFTHIFNFEYSLNNRLLSFDSGLLFFQSSPWLGVGANQTFTLLSSSFDITTLNRYEGGILYYDFFQIHNSFIRILAELGFIGFLLFTAFCLTIIRQSYGILKLWHSIQQNHARALLLACALWLISFIVFYQTVGWFEPGHPQLSWLVCFLTLMNFIHESGRKSTLNLSSLRSWHDFSGRKKFVNIRNTLCHASNAEKGTHLHG